MILPLSVSSMMMDLTDCRKSGCCSVVSCEFIVLSCEGFSPPSSAYAGAGSSLVEGEGTFTLTLTLSLRERGLIANVCSLCMMSMIRTNVCVVKREGTECFVSRRASNIEIP